MKNSRILRKSILSTAAAIVLSMVASPGVLQADGEFLTPFDPAYPPTTAGGYDSFVNGFNIPVDIDGPGPIPPIIIPIPGIDDIPGLLVDGDGDGNVNDERCDTNGEGIQQFVLAGVNAGDVLGNAICNAITPETAESPCWIALGVIQEAFVIAETNAAQCEFQDALVDGAEIEAGYENTVKLISLNTKIYEKQLEDNLLSCTPVVGLILPEAEGGLAEWVATFVEKRIDQFELAIGDANRVAKARAKLAKGNADFTTGLYEDAYKKGYCKAYAALAIGV